MRRFRIALERFPPGDNFSCPPFGFPFVLKAFYLGVEHYNLPRASAIINLAKRVGYVGQVSRSIPTFEFLLVCVLG